MRPHRQIYSSVPAMIEHLEVRRVPSAVTANASQSLVGSQASQNQAAGSQSAPEFAIDSKGDFVAVGANSGQFGSQPGIYAQVFNASGIASSPVFRVDSDTTGRDVQPTVAMDGAGDFVVAWLNENQSGTQSAVFAREFNLSGQALSAEFRVNISETGNPQLPDVAMDSAGDFIVSWSSQSTDGSDVILAQRFNSMDAPQGGVFPVDNSSNANRITPTVEIDPTGNMTSSHQTYAEDISLYGVFAQNGIGYYPGSEFQFTTGSTPNNAYAGMPTEDEGAWFWT